MVKVQIVIDLELAADPGTDAAVDAWAWAVERQIETLELVTSASVVDFTVTR